MESTALFSSLLSLIEERNARETIPFEEIHNSNQELAIQVNQWRFKCNELEQKLVLVQESLSIAEAAAAALSSSLGQDQNNTNSGPSSSSSSSAALRNERKMREQLERLEGQLQQKSEQHQQDVQRIEDLVKEKDHLEILKDSQENTIAKLQEENDQRNHLIQHLQTENRDNQQRTNLAEQQYAGLKDAIRVLQEENDSLQKENRQLEKRLVSEKDNLVNELNNLTEMMEQLKRQAAMSQTLQQQEEKRRKDGWFQLSSSSNVNQSPSITPNIAPTETETTIADKVHKVEVQRPVVASVVPSKPKHVITAHFKEASCVK
jgi:chromosome segregation ATPase